MKAKFIYCLLLSLSIVFFAGCKTVKETAKLHEKTEIEQQADVRAEAIRKVESKTDERKDTKVDEQSNVNEQISIIKLSLPDSVGRQYPTELITILRGSNVNKSTVIEQNKHAERHTESKLKLTDNTKLKSKSETDLTIKTKSKPTTPAWIIWGVVILSVGLLVFVYLILKRYKIIK